MQRAERARAGVARHGTRYICHQVFCFTAAKCCTIFTVSSRDSQPADEERLTEVKILRRGVPCGRKKTSNLKQFQRLQPEFQQPRWQRAVPRAKLVQHFPLPPKLPRVLVREFASKAK